MSIRKASAQNINGSDGLNKRERYLNENKIKELLLELSHHAYCFISEDIGKGKEMVLNAVSSAWNVPPSGDPDLLFYSKEIINIEDALFLRDWIAANPVKRPRKVCLIDTYGLTEESQNALLKAFESSSDKVCFILIIPSRNVLLATLFSRMSVSYIEGGSFSDVSVEKFLRSNISKRYEILKSIIEDRDKAGARRFLDSLEVYLYKNIKETSSDSEDLDRSLRTLSLIKRINADQRSSVKAVMDHVIHFTPILKKEDQLEQEKPR
ncbi:MAG: hypothetical protein ACLFNR_02425 [Candidatus Paceibacterota bacterium]